MSMNQTDLVTILLACLAGISFISGIYILIK